MPGMQEQGDIFLGSTHSTERSFLSQVLNVTGPHYKRLIIPCVGKFASAEAALQSLTWPMNRLETSDISLFSTLLGRYIMKDPIVDLNVKLNVEGEDPVQMMAKSKSYHSQLFVEDLVIRKDFHKAAIKRGMDLLADKLHGLKYQVKDLTAHFESAMDDPGAVIWVNPPAFQNGYTKMFDTAGRVTWDEPTIPEFDAKAGPLKLAEMEDNAKALVLRYRTKELWEGDAEKAIFASHRSASAVEYILTNRPDEVKQMLGLTVVPKRSQSEFSTLSRILRRCFQKTMKLLKTPKSPGSKLRTARRCITVICSHIVWERLALSVISYCFLMATL